MPTSAAPRKPRVRVNKGAAAPGPDNPSEAAGGPQGAPPTPSEQLIRQALVEDTITTSKGTRILIRKPHVLTQFRIVEALGSLSENNVYMMMINPILWVSSIDGDPVFTPNSKLEVEALITRLGEDDLGEVMAWYMANVMQVTDAMVSDAERQAAEKSRLKNS